MVRAGDTRPGGIGRLTRGSPRLGGRVRGRARAGFKGRVEIAEYVRHLGGGMKFILATHNVTLTDAIEQHVLQQIDKLEHIDRWLIDARVTLERDHVAHSPEKQYKCGIRIGVRGNDLFAEDRESDLYAAIDLTVKKLQAQLRARHSKVKAKTHKQAARLKERRRVEPA
jgi:ribosomal subunit interface protein